MHAYWGDLGEENLLQEIKPTLHGHKTPAFELNQHRFTPRLTRFEVLTEASSAAILQQVADAGSYHHRLSYTIKRLQDLKSSPIHSALLAAIEKQLLMLPAPDPHTPIQYATKIQPYSQRLYELCRVIGCENLSIDISLDTLPHSKVLLDRCFELSWDLFYDSIQAWLVQLNRMIDKNSHTSAKLIRDHPDIYIPDMFCKIQNSRFVVCYGLIPDFMPKKYAEMSVECLNYKYTLEIGASKMKLSTKLLKHNQKFVDPFADTSDRHYSFTPKTMTPVKKAKDKVFAVYEMLCPVMSHHMDLTDECHAVLQPLLRIHLRIICDVFLLMNGPLWVICREEVASFKYRPSRAQLEPMNRFIRQIAPPCIKLDLQMNENLVKHVSDNIVVEYSPPKELELIFTKQLIESCNSAFSILLQLQQESKKSPTDTKELSIYSAALKHRSLELETVIESKFTLNTIISEFSKFRDTLLDI